MIIAPILNFAGLIAGIVDLFKKDSKKVFPIIGVVINSLAVLIAAVCWILIIMVGVLVLSSGIPWR